MKRITYKDCKLVRFAIDRKYMFSNVKYSQSAPVSNGSALNDLERLEYSFRISPVNGRINCVSSSIVLIYNSKKRIVANCEVFPVSSCAAFYFFGFEQSLE